MGTWLSYKVGTLVKSERTGWYAAILYNASIYTSVIAGTFILPDSPQVVFWLAAMMVVIKMVRQFNENIPVKMSQWILLGMLTGICIMCKVHGVFLWCGFGLYLISYRRSAFLKPQFYIAIVITAIVFSPIIWWNINNHFVTWNYHGNRVAIHDTHIDIDSFMQALLGQIFYNNPVNVFIVCAAIYFYRRNEFMGNRMYHLLLFLGLPIIMITSIISLFDNVLPHWSGPGFLTLNFVAAAYLDERSSPEIKYPMILKGSLAVIFLAISIGVGVINFFPGTLGSKEEMKYGSGDFTLDLCGWRDFKKQYETWLQQEDNGDRYGKLKFVCNEWFPAAHIGYYVAWPLHTDVIGVGNLNDLHNFAWLNKNRMDLKRGEDALCIVPSNYSFNVQEIYESEFSSVTEQKKFTIFRSGKVARYFTVYLLKDYQAIDQVHNLSIR